MSKVVHYKRVSTGKAKTLSLKDQQEAIKKLAIKKDFKFIDCNEKEIKHN